MSEGGQGGVSPTLDELALEVSRLRELIESRLPLTPLYSLDQACTLLPARPRSLAQMLYRYRHELDLAMYRQDSRHRRYRMLSQADLVKLRAHLIRRPGQRTRAQVHQALAQAA